MNKAKAKSRYVSVIDKIYNFQVIGVYGGTAQESINWYAKKLKVDPWEIPDKNRYAHFSGYFPRRETVIWFKEDYPPANIVAHECFHAVMYLFETLDMNGPTKETEEVFAYYLQFLVSNLYFVKKTKNK